MVTVSLTGASKEDAATVFDVLRTAFPIDRPSDAVPQEQPGDHPAVWTAEFVPTQERIPTGPTPGGLAHRHAAGRLRRRGPGR